MVLKRYMPIVPPNINDGDHYYIMSTVYFTHDPT